MNRRVLVVDDQLSLCRHLNTLLDGEGYEVSTSGGAEEALDELSRASFDVLLVDMKMPGMNGLELFRAARCIDPDLSCIVMTAYGSISSAVDAIKEGVADYVQKPFEPEVLLLVLDKTFREREMVQQIRDLRKEVDQRYSYGNIVGKSREMKRVYDLIEKVAPTGARVLITGETGVGKELVAKAIHFNSPRRDNPFVPVNCGALPETLLESELFGHEKGAFTGAHQARQGRFEYAKGGTVFLDEIGDISPVTQVKLLRVLQEGEFERVGGNEPIRTDVRIVAATNQNLSQKIRNNEFRADLFYRLNVVELRIPALRERKEDIPALVRYFVHQLNDRLHTGVETISSHAMDQLMRYDWPGNVRELENVLEKHFVTASGSTIDDIAFNEGAQLPFQSLEAVNVDIPFEVARTTILRGFERAYLAEALRRFEWNVAETARRTGIHPRTMWRKIKEFALERDAVSR